MKLLHSTLAAAAVAAALGATTQAAYAEPFSGAAAKAWITNRVIANAKDNKETTALGQVLKVPTGISVDDMKKYGPCGGPNSECNKVRKFLSKPFG